MCVCLPHNFARQVLLASVETCALETNALHSQVDHRVKESYTSVSLPGPQGLGKLWDVLSGNGTARNALCGWPRSGPARFGTPGWVFQNAT